MFRRWALTIHFIALALAGAHAAPPEDEMGAIWAKEWAENNKELAVRRERARATVLSDFDKAIDKVDRQKGLTPAARTDRRKELQAARKTFEKDGTFPPDDEFAAIELAYFKKINKAAIPVSRLIDEVIEKGSKTKNDALEERGLKMKTHLEERLGAANRLEGNSVWHGQLRRADGQTIPYHLYIGKKGGGGLFKGHVEDNPGVAGNWAYDVEGQTRALGVQYKMSKNLRGNFTAVSVEGIVSGNRLITNIVQVAGRGKPTSAL